MIRDYNSNYKIKEFFINQLAPKMFDMEDVNQYTVGLLGYVTEMASTTTEDAFNAMNIYVKETHASRATMADTIFTNASIYSVENIMGTEARLEAVLFIKEKDIIEKGVPSEDRFMFTYDSEVDIIIGGITYSLDYDIIISARPFRGDYQFQSQYDMSIRNSISKVLHPYLKTSRFNMQGDKYIGVAVTLSQYKRIEQEENILVDTSLAIPRFQMSFDDHLADIDVYYRENPEQPYILLEKRMEGTVPSKRPFFFYSLKQDKVFEVSFTNRDKYFQPAFNSELKIVAYSTLASKGNFKEYTGSDVHLIVNGNRFDYMTQIITFFNPVGPSTGGIDSLSLEDIRTLTVENMAVSGAYNTEDDITLFFRNYTDINNMHITFIRKRDDLVERLFTGFVIMKDSLGDYYHTNTLDTRLILDDFDYHAETLGRHILKPGRIFSYKGDSKHEVSILPHEANPTNYKEYTDDEFVYTNPFLITFQHNPNNILYYINTIEDGLAVDFAYANDQSEIQFIINSLTVSRNALIGENSYKFSVRMRPTKDVIRDSVSGKLETDGKIKVGLTFEDRDGTQSKAIMLEEAHYDEKDKIFTFEGYLHTNDVISSDGRLLGENVINLDTGVTGEFMINMYDIISHVTVMYDMGKEMNYHPFKDVDGLEKFTVVNDYTTESNKMNLVIPFNFVRSRLQQGVYIDDKDNKIRYMDISQIPMLAAHHIDAPKDLMRFISEVKHMYYILKGITTEKTSNYNIDLKFYNTFGRSKNFTVGEDADALDKVNIDFHIKVRPVVGTLVEEMFLEIKEFIKEYIENLNNNISTNIGVRGYNALYVSNLIQELENNFPNLSYMKFVKINDYDSTIQVIENNTINIEDMTLVARRDYIPEFLTIRLEDIQIDLLSR